MAERHDGRKSCFRYGDVRAQTAGEHAETILFEDIPKPVEVAERILQLHNALVEKETREQEHATAEGELHGRIMKVRHDLRGTIASGEWKGVRPDERKTLEKKPPDGEPPPQPPSSPPPPPKDGDVSSGTISGEDLEKGGEVEIK